MGTAKLATTPSSNLTNVEFYNFVTEQTTRITALGPQLTDEDLKRLLSNCTIQAETLKTTQNRVMKSLKSDELPKLDHSRAICFSAVKSEVRNARYSVDPEEQHAAMELTILLDTYGDVSSLPYKVESTTLDKLLEDMENPTYKPFADKLGLQTKLKRLKDSNQAFKDLYTARQDETMVEDEVKAIEQRKLLNKSYQLLCDYVLLKATLSDNEQYSQSLLIINTIREEYNKTVALKKGVRKANQDSTTDKK